MKRILATGANVAGGKTSNYTIIVYPDSKILSQVSAYVEELLGNRLPTGHIFHNLNHTRLVVQAAGEICGFMSVSKPEQEIVLIAAWFHDAGHVVICDGHEEESKRMAGQFLTGAHYPAPKIEKVLQCIEATKVPQRPADMLGEILCDADLYHLAANDYFMSLAQLREEWSQIKNENYTDADWFQLNLHFLQAHQYFTGYGRAVLERRKQAAIEVLEMSCKFYGP
jgi:uncharacterized protein